MFDSISESGVCFIILQRNIRHVKSSNWQGPQVYERNTPNKFGTSSSIGASKSIGIKSSSPAHAIWLGSKWTLCQIQGNRCSLFLKDVESNKTIRNQSMQQTIRLKHVAAKHDMRVPPQNEKKNTTALKSLI